MGNVNKNALIKILNEFRNVSRYYIEDKIDEGFQDGIEIGIQNTVAALYEANIPDDKITTIVCKIWNITPNETRGIILLEKQQAVIRSIKNYLKMERGYSENQIEEYFSKNLVGIKIRHNAELWKLKDVPDEVLRRIEE